MPVNINNLVPRMFHGFEIDTSNWPSYHEFLSNLSTIPAEWTREQWLRVICRTPEIYQREYDKYLFYRRKLMQFEILPTQLHEKYSRDRGHRIDRLQSDLERKGFFTTSESVFFFSSFEQSFTDIRFFEELPTRFSDEINTLEKKQQLFLALQTNLFDIVKIGYTLEQTDFFFLSLIFDTFYEKVYSNPAETKDENNDLKGEFIMYYLFKKIFFDTQLYSYIQSGMKQILINSMKEKVNLPPRDDIKSYQYNISEMISPHNIIPYLASIIFIKLNNSSRFKKLSKQNRNVFFNSLFTLFSPGKYLSSTTGVRLMIDSNQSDKYEFFANFFINGEDVLYLLCLFIYPYRYIKEHNYLKYVIPSIDQQLSRHNNLRNKYDFKKTYKIGSSAEIIIQSPDDLRGETDVPMVRKFLAWALKNKITKVPTPSDYFMGLMGNPLIPEDVATREGEVKPEGIKVNLSKLNKLYKYFTAPRENGKFNYINFFISFLKKNWIADITVYRIHGHTICPPLKYLGKFKDENEPYKITPPTEVMLERIASRNNRGEKVHDDDERKRGGGRMKNRTIKHRRKNKRKTLKL